MMQLDAQAMQDIAVGAAVLGTGGGGDPTLGRLMAQQAVAQHGPISLLSLDEFAYKERVIPTAMMGAPNEVEEE